MTQPLQFEPVEVVLEGLSQKDDRKASTPGKLRHAVNVEFDKSNSLNKRRGYVRVPLATSTTGDASELLFVSAATFRQELVIYGREHVSSVVARDDIVSGAAIVRRGPTLPGNYRVHNIFTSPIAEPDEWAEEEEEE